MVEKFAQRLNHLRVEAGLSFKELSQEVNISTASLCRWENGITDVKGEQIVILAKFFNVLTDYLLGVVDY